MPGQDPFLQVGDPADVSQINPNTGNVFNMLSQLLGQSTRAGQLAQQTVGGFDPTAANQAFLAAAPGLQNVALGATNPLAQSQINLAGQLGLQGVHDQSALAASQGIPLSSSAFATAATRAAALPQQQALANIMQAQTGLASQLLGGGQQQFGQAFNLIPQLAAQISGQQAGLQGQAAGTLGGLGMPEFFQPTFVENPDFFSGKDLIATILGAGNVVGSFF